MLELSGAEVEKGVWARVGLGVGIILYYLVSPQLFERHRLYISDDVLNSKFRQLHKSRLLVQWANRDKILERNRGQCGKADSVLWVKVQKIQGRRIRRTLSMAGRLIETARGGLVLPTRDWKM